MRRAAPWRPAGALSLGGTAALAVVAAFVWAPAAPGSTAVGDGALPVFARLYRTSCSTCHTAAPKLNVLGEAFRLNGYRLPDNPQLIRRMDPVELGAEEWEQLWPRAIWPGEIPGLPPISLRVQSDIRVTREEGSRYAWTYQFPHEVYLLSGANLGESIAAFLEAEWEPEEGFEFAQAKLQFQDLVPSLPSRSLNLKIGLQSLYLFTFAERQIDRAARQPFLWQRSRLSAMEVLLPDRPEAIRGANEVRLGRTQPALELDGLIAGRLYWGAGLAQGGAGAVDDNTHKDLYYKLRYKLGGLRLDGTYDEGDGPVPGGHGQLLDRSLVLEHFGYFGEEPVDADHGNPHRSWGFAARALFGRLDIGAGYVRTVDDRPWGPASGSALRESAFGKAEYLFYPWLLGSLKAEDFRVELPAGARRPGQPDRTSDEVRIMPGLVVLVRQNIRAVAEAELFAGDAPVASPEARRPHNLWLRLDVAF